MDWTPEVLSRTSMKNQQQLKHHLRVEEALWIRRLKCGPGKGLKEDIKTDAWTPIFGTMWSLGKGGGRGIFPCLSSLVFLPFSSSPLPYLVIFDALTLCLSPLIPFIKPSFLPPCSYHWKMIFAIEIENFGHSYVPALVLSILNTKLEYYLSCAWDDNQRYISLFYFINNIFKMG